MGEPEESKPPLTGPQSEILAFIRNRCRESGAPPSYREIQHHFGYRAVGTVQDHIRALRRKGYIERPKAIRTSRGLIPSDPSLVQPKRLPVYGEIAAGSARMSEQIEIGTVFVPEGKFKGTCFALRVVGDSMIDVGIYEGDILIVERQSQACSGEIVVALVNGETTVKRYVERESGRFLIAENRRFAPIPLEGVDFSIQGRIAGLHRTL